VTTATSLACTATVHDTASAYRKHGCTCPTAREAERTRKAGYDRTRRNRSRETKPNCMGRYEHPGVPAFHADPRRNCAALKNPDLMFAESGPALREAVRVCDGCPFKDECHDWAVENGQIWGVWGGVPAPARRHEIIRRAKTRENA
jgi:WhiB family redox-sensing transcriptional regulator